MEDRSKHIDDLFREGLSDYKELPSADVWQSLEQRLPAVKQPSKRWMWWIVLAAVLVTLSYFIINKAAEKKTNDNKSNPALNSESVNNIHSSTTIEKTPKDIASTAKKTEDVNLVAKKENNNHQNTQTKKTRTNSINPSTTSVNRSNNNNADNDVHFTKSYKATTTKSVNNKTSHNGLKKSTTTVNKTVKESQNKKDDSNSANTDNNVAANNTSKNDKINTDNNTSSANDYNSSNNSSTQNNVASQQATPKNNKNSSNKIANNNNNATSSNSNIATTKNKSTRPTKNKSNKTVTSKNKSKQTSLKEEKNTTSKNHSLSNNKPHNTQSTSEDQSKQQSENDKQVVKNKKQNANNKSAANKKHTEQDQPIKTAKKKNKDANTDESSHKELDVVAAGSGKSDLNINPAKDGKKKEFDVKPAPLKKPKPIDVKPATSNKNSNLVINDVSWKKKNIEPLAPAKEPQKKTFEVTSNGVKIMTDDEDKLTEEEQKAATINEPATATKETEKPEEVLLATGTKPNPVMPSTSGGGGGANEPNVPLRNFNNKLKFEGGIKAGYERGTNSFTNSTMIVAPFLQWNISKSFAVMLQPGFRYNQLSRTDIFDMTKSYHQINAASLDTVNYYVFDTTGGVLSIQRNYIYKNQYDSIIIKNALKTKNYWEVEIPIMLRFNAATNLAILGGMSLTFGNIIQVQEARTTITGLQRYDSLSYAAAFPNSPPPQVPPLNNYFSYNTADIGTAPPANNQNPATNPPRLGLMFGISYELQDRVTFDLMVKKNISDMKYIPNEDIRKIYTQPSFRLMIGYKLFKSEKEKVYKNASGL